MARLPAAMSEPYVMQWYPSDGGYASLAVHAFDLATREWRRIADGYICGGNGDCCAGLSCFGNVCGVPPG